MIDIQAWEKALHQLPAGAREAELNLEHRSLGLARLADGESAGGDRSDTLALYLRVSGDRTGYLYTQDPEDSPEACLARAYASSLVSGYPIPDEMHRADTACRRDFGATAAQTDPGFLRDFARDFDATIRSLVPFPIRLNLALKAETLGMRTLNSHGLDAGFERPLYVLNATASAERDGRRFSASYNQTASSLERLRAGDFAAALAWHLRSQFDVAAFRSGEYPAVLGNLVVYNILSTAWQVFSGKRCAEGSSLLSQAERGLRLSPCLNLVDYPAHPDAGFDFPCDCEGTAGHPAELVREGIFIGLLHNLGTAKAFGDEPTGNAGRRPLLYGNIPTEIQVTPRTVRLEPGTASQEELIASMGEGVLVTGSFDVFHSINIASGAFSIPCRGVVVRNGQATTATGPIVMSGNLRTLACGIRNVGNDSYTGTMLALDSYGIGACSLQVDTLSFSGV